MLGAVKDRPEAHPFVLHLEGVGEAEHLETTRIREDRTAPVHEGVQTSRSSDDARPGTQVEVVRVGQDHLCPDGFELLWRDALDRGSGADGHESGREDVPVSRVEHAPPSSRGGVGRDEIESEGGHGRDSSRKPVYYVVDV
jgi:hypothetical protein